jgi:hypothetical protein
MEIINNTRGASRVKFGSAVMGGKLKSRMNMRHTILGLHLKPEKFKTRVTILGIFISFTCFACHYYKNSPQILSKRLIPLEKIKIADISITLERSQKCVIDKIEVKMLGKN